MPVDSKSYPKTTKSVNDYLKKQGVPDELVRGKGYFYFDGKDTVNWESASVYVPYISDLTFGRWYEEWKFMNDKHVKSQRDAPEYNGKRLKVNIMRKDKSAAENTDEALSPGTLKDAPSRPHWADDEDGEIERDPPWHFDHKWIEGLHFIDDEWLAYGVKGSVVNPNIANEIAGVLNNQYGTHLAADDISISRMRKIRGNNEYYFIIVKNHWPTVNKFKRKLKTVTVNRDESNMSKDTAAPVLGKWQEGIFKPPGGGYAIGLKSPKFAINKGNVAKLIVIQAKKKLGMDIEPKHISFGALMRDKSDKNKIIATFHINSKDAAATDIAARVNYGDHVDKFENSASAIRSYLEAGGIIWANPSTKKKGGYAIFVVGGPSGPLATVNNIADLRSWMKIYRVKPKNVEEGGDLWRALSKVPGWNKDIATQETDMTEKSDIAAPVATGAVKPYFFTFVYDDVDKTWNEETGFKTEKEAKSERDFLKESDGKRVRIVKVPYKMKWTSEVHDKILAKVKAAKGSAIIDCMDCASVATENEDIAKALGPKAWYFVTNEKTGKVVLKTKEHAKVKEKCREMYKDGVRFKVRLGSDANEPATVKVRIKKAAAKRGVLKVRGTSDKALKGISREHMRQSPDNIRRRQIAEMKKKDKASIETNIDQATFDNLDVAARLDFPSVISELLTIFSKTQPGTEKTIPWRSVKTNAAKSVLQSFAARIKQSAPEFSLDIGENWAVTIKRPDGMTMNKFAAAMRPPSKSA